MTPEEHKAMSDKLIDALPDTMTSGDIANLIGRVMFAYLNDKESVRHVLLMVAHIMANQDLPDRVGADEPAKQLTH